MSLFLESMQGQFQDFTEQLNTFAREHQLDNLVQPDHFNIKYATQSEYEKAVYNLRPDREYRFESRVAGREVSYIHLKHAIPTNLGFIWYLELSEPKPQRTEKTRFHHVEIYPTNTTYEKLVHHLQSRGVALVVDNPGHHPTYDHILPSGFIIRVTPEPLLLKIAREQLRFDL